MRVGVNTGEVLVGALRAGGDYTAMGDVVNTASGCRTPRPRARSWSGAATHAATADVIRYEALRADGRQGPRGARRRVDRARARCCRRGTGPAGSDSPLVGREPELGLLTGAIDVAVRTAPRPA